MKKYIKKLILGLIFIIEFIEYFFTKVNPEDAKILNTINLKDYEIKTDTGWSPISYIHKTIPFVTYEIRLENNKGIILADTHILYDENLNEIYAKDVKPGTKLKTEDGNITVISNETLKFPISMYDVSVEDFNNRYLSNGFLSHNTTTTAAFLAWYLCFHRHRNIAVLANKQTTAIEIVSKVVDIFKGLPFFLKPGIISIGALGMRLDNGCMLMSQATTKTAQVGFTIHVLYADEFAHIPGNIVNEFWRSTYPTLSSSDISQCIISSTPNGVDNKFFEIWDNAIRGKNSFCWSRVDWWEIPGHDEMWAEQMKKDFGAEEFAQEFELQFNVSSKLLLGINELPFLTRIEKQYVNKKLEKTRVGQKHFEKMYWHPNFDPNEDFNPKTDKFVFTIDISEGNSDSQLKDSDYNVASLYKIVPKSLSNLRKLHKDEYEIRNMFRLVQVGLYRDNNKDEEHMAKVVRTIVFEQLPEEATKVLVEMNFNGKNFITHFRNHVRYEGCYLLYTQHTKGLPGEKVPPMKPGYKTTNDKDKFCKLGKSLICNRTLIPNDNISIKEFRSFGKDNKGRYKGIGCHDDTSMANLNVSRLYNEKEQYEEMLYEILENMENSVIKSYINELLNLYDSGEIEDITDEDFANTYSDDSYISDYTIPDYVENPFQNNTYNPGYTFPTKNW